MSDLKKFFRREGEQQICNNRHSLTPVLILRDTVFGFDFFYAVKCYFDSTAL